MTLAADQVVEQPRVRVRTGGPEAGPEADPARRSSRRQL